MSLLIVHSNKLGALKKGQ